MRRWITGFGAAGALMFAFLFLTGADVIRRGVTTVYNLMYKAAGAGSVSRSMASKLGDVVSVQDFTGATAGAQIQAAHDSLTSSGGVIHAEMLTGAQTISSTINITKPVTIILPPPGSANFTVTSNPAFYVNGTNDVTLLDGKLTLSGVNASGVKFATVTDLTVDNMTITGSGVVGDAQQGIYSDAGGQVATLLRFTRNTISNVMIGIIMHLNVDGTFALVDGNRLTNIVGTGSGQGYGIAFDNVAPNKCQITITNNTVELAQRHSIYHSVCDGGVIANNSIRLHRSGVCATALRSAIVVDRSQDVTVNGNFIDRPCDGAIEVDPDILNCGALCVSRNIVVSNNVVVTPKNWAAFTIGDDATSSGFPEGISLIGNTVYKDVTTAGDNNYLVEIKQGKRISLIGNMLYLLNTTATTSAFLIRGIGETAGTATYTDDLYFRNNTVYMTNNGGTSFAFEWISAASTSAMRVELTNNRWNIPSGGSNAAHLFDAVQTNPNIFSMGNSSDTGLKSSLLAKLSVGSIGIAAGNGGMSVLTDDSNTGDTRLICDTRTGTASSVTSDACNVQYQRGGSRKWDVGLNYGNEGVDSFDFSNSGGSTVVQLLQAGKFGVYNQIATVGYGVPALHGSLVALTAQTANLGATNVYASAPAGFYRVCVNARTTTSGSGTTANVNIIWTDEGGAKTDALGTFALNSVTVTGQINKCEYIHAAASSAIQVSVTAGTYGTSVYALDATAERLN